MHARFSDFILLFILSVLWGSSYVAVKLVLVDLEPLSLATIRIIISAVMLIIYMKFLGEKLPTDLKSWQTLTIVGLGGMALPFFLIGWGLTEMPSGQAGVIIAATPIMTLALSHFMISDHKVTKKQSLGMLLGFSGVFILMGGFSVFEINSSNIAKFAIVLAAFGYAYTAVRLHELNHLSPTVGATGLTIVSAVIMFIFSLFNTPIWQVSMNMDSILIMLYLAVFSTVIGTIIMTKLIFRAGPYFMSLNNFLVPVVAIILGVLLLSETISKDLALSSVLILLGVGLAAPKKPSSKLKRL